MPRQHDYRVDLVWTGADHGTTSSYDSYSREFAVHIDGKPPLTGSADPTFRGDPALYNPEDMLLVALSACHLLSYLAECSRAGIHVISYRDAATGTMSRQDGKMRFTGVVLYPTVEIAESDDLDKAIALHEQAHDGCFIANSVSFPVHHSATVTISRSVNTN